MGELFNKLPNKEEIQCYLGAYAGYDETRYGTRPASLDHLLRFWEESKVNLYHLLGDNFIIEKPIEYKEDGSSLENLIYKETHYGGRMQTFSDNFSELIINHYDEINCYRVLKDAEHTHDKVTLTTLLSLTYNSYLAVNSWNRESMKWELPNGRILDIQRGCKPIKILAKIAQAYDIEGFEEFRIAHSMIIGKGTTRGTLCLSIHPLDYMTMSDNTYDWESCMNWREGGQYRMGTVEMMNSPYVLVAYLKGEKPFRFYGGEWNNKKWRNLVIADKEVLTTIKGYPFQSDELNKIVINWIQDLAIKNWHIDYPYGVDGLSVECEDITVPFDEDNTEDTKDFCFKTNVMYNDFGNNNFISIRFNRPDTSYCKIIYSGTTECMFCGEALTGIDYDLEDSCYVIGSCCMDSYECDHCGCHMTGSENRYEVDGETICESCYENDTVYDAYDENRHFPENCFKVYLLDNDENLDDNNIFRTTNHRMVWLLEDNLTRFERYGLKTDRNIKTVTIKEDYGWWSSSKTYYYVLEDDLNGYGDSAFRNFGEWD